MLRKLLDRPIMVTMGLLVVIVLGIVAVRLLPVSLIPDIDAPRITVQLKAPELSSDEIEESLLRILRQSLVQVSFLEDIRTEASDGDAQVFLEFSPGTDMDYCFIEVNEKIDRFMGVADGIDRPKVLKSSASDIPAFYVNLTLKEKESAENRASGVEISDKFIQLSTYATEVISRRIEQLDEVALVDVSGCVQPELLIIPDESKLRQLGLTLSRLEDEIKAANIRLGSLSIRDGEYHFNVKFHSFASNRDDICAIPVNCSGRIFRLDELAEVIEHPAERAGLVRSDGADAVTFAVVKQADAKMADLKKEMKTLKSDLEKDYPDIEFKITRDQTELLEYSINNLLKNIIIGIILSCIIIFLFMQDFRSPALVALSIPVALIFSMLVFYLVGLTINIISLSGLILGVGMMVDNTIVLTDNITARWQRGDTLRTAVLEGTSEVRGPMLSSVLTTCSVFIPLIFLSGTAGVMFYDQAMSVSIVLLTSYLVTITIIPVYYWNLYKRLPAFRPNPWLSKLSGGWGMNLYEKGLKWVFRHRVFAWGVFVLSVALIFVAIKFMPRAKLPDISYSDTILLVDWNAPVSLEVNSERTAGIETVAGAVESTALVGAQEFFLGHDYDTGLSETLIYLKFKDVSELENTKSVIGEYLRTTWPEATFEFHTAGNIFDMVFSETDSPLVARIRPVSGTKLEFRTVKKMIDGLAEEMPEMKISTPVSKTDLLYVADPEKMLLYGIDFTTLLSALRNALNQNELFSIVQGSRSLPVVLGSGDNSLDERMDAVFLLSEEGTEIPVSAVMKQTWEENFKTLVAGIEGRYYPLEIDVPQKMTVKAMEKIRKSVRESGLFDVSFSGSYFSSIKMLKEMILVLLISVLLLFLILASQFESLIQPLVILSELVLDISFSLLALWACGVSINLMSLIGLVVVCGIVINDSILKIDTINQLRKAGFGLRTAIMEAGHRRLKAIVMTSLTTILSVCPFLLRGSIGDDLQFPMSIVIVAGMTVGTIVSLFFVPLVYFEIYESKQ